MKTYFHNYKGRVVHPSDKFDPYKVQLLFRYQFTFCWGTFKIWFYRWRTIGEFSKYWDVSTPITVNEIKAGIKKVMDDRKDKRIKRQLRKKLSQVKLIES